MSSSQDYKLAEVAELINKRVDISEATLENYVSTENMLPNYGGVCSAEKLPTASSINSFVHGDVLFSNIRTYFKKVWFSTFDGTVSPDVLVLRAEQSICHDKYLYYLLCNPDFIEFTVQTSKGAKMPRGDKEAMLNYSFSLPTLPEQQTIAEVLSSFDDKIDLLHRNNKTLEQMAETLYRQWFVVEAKNEWEESTFGNFVQPKKGKNITKSEAIDGEYPVVAGGLEPSCYHNAANTKSPVITVSASGANAGFIKLYHTPVWSSDSSFIDETTTPYVYFSYVYLKSNQSQLTDKQEGSAQPHIYPSHIMELDMPMFPETLISHFDAEVKPLFQKIKSNTQQIENLKTLRDSLLPKLMSGQVRVEQK